MLSTFGHLSTEIIQIHHQQNKIDPNKVIVIGVLDFFSEGETERREEQEIGNESKQTLREQAKQTRLKRMKITIRMICQL